MKSIKAIISLFTFSIFFMVNVSAQNDRYQMFLVHEDHVKDGMTNKHMEADKALLEAAKKHKMQGMEWLMFQSDDNRIMYLSPINNFADLDKNPFGELKENMGEDAFEKLFDAFEGTYTKHGDYILRLDNELSYMPEGAENSSQNQTYRELVFYHVPPGKEEKAEDLAKSAKKLYASKKSKVHYRVYKSGLGVMGNYYMVAVSGKDAVSVDKMRKENMKLLGKDGEDLFKRINNNTSKQEIVTGHVKPDLSYSLEN